MKLIMNSYDEEEKIDLTTNNEIITFKKAELIIKSDNLEIKKVYKDSEYNAYGFLFSIMEILKEEKNVVIKEYNYINKADRALIAYKEICFEELQKMYWR